MFLVIAPPRDQRPNFGDSRDSVNKISVPLRKRRGLPKVHSGCVTCKTRRIKCDEEKPSCFRCRTFFKGTTQKCGGYISRAAPKTKAPSPPKRDILPKHAAQIARRAAMASLSDTKFDSSEQFLYFQFFCEKVADKIGGGFSNDLWRTKILQETQQEPCLRQAVAAIGALSKVMKEYKRGSQMVVNEHYRFAIQEYGRALVGMTKWQDTPIRTTLIATLLIYCFENFHGNPLSGLHHVQSAANLLHDWLKQRETRKIANGALSPAPNVVEDSVLDAFHATHMQVITWIDPKKSEAPDVVQGAKMYISFPVPSSFSSVAEASFTLTGISRQLIGFMFSMAIASPTEFRPEEPKYDTGSLWNRHPNIPSSMLTEYFEIDDKINRWYTAFEPLLKSTQPTDPDFITIQILNAQGLTSSISFRVTLFPNTPPEVSIPVYQEIVDICRMIAAHPSFERAFVFDAGIVPCLTAATKYGAAETRKRAIEVLLDIVPRREGAWDAAVSATNAIISMRSNYDTSSPWGWAMPIETGSRKKNISFSDSDLEMDTSGDESLMTPVDSPDS